MASNSGQGHGFSDLIACTVWNGENESDAELMEGYDSPLADAGAWTEGEAYRVYREKLVRLRDLYVGQLDHMRRNLQKQRRQFLLQWQYEKQRQKTDVQALRGNSLEDIAYRHYRRKSGEEALLERKSKQKRVAASLEYLAKKEGMESHKEHYHYLLHQHHEMSQPSCQCSNVGCDNNCLPFSIKCSRHICEDESQFLYTKCLYVYPSGLQCTNPVPKYLEPLLCGGHCDNIRPPGCSGRARDSNNASDGRGSDHCGVNVSLLQGDKGEGCTK